MLVKDYSSGKNCKNELYVWSKSDEKRTRNLHKLLKEKIKNDGPDKARSRDTKHAKSTELFEGIRAGSIFVGSECERSYKSTYHPSYKELTRTKMIFLRQDEVPTVWKHGKEDIRVPEEWSDCESCSIEFWKDKYNTRSKKGNKQSDDFSLLYCLIEKKVWTDQDKYRREQVDDLRSANIGKFYPISIEYAIDSNPHTYRDEEKYMLPWVFPEPRHKWKNNNKSDKVAENREHPRWYFCEDKFRANDSDGPTESDRKEENYFLHEFIYFALRHTVNTHLLL